MSVGKLEATVYKTFQRALEFPGTQFSAVNIKISKSY